MKDKIIKYVGHEASIKKAGLSIDVVITDYSVVYGKERFLVEPLKGSGKIWVESVKLKTI